MKSHGTDKKIVQRDGGKEKAKIEKDSKTWKRVAEGIAVPINLSYVIDLEGRSLRDKALRWIKVHPEVLQACCCAL